MNMPKNNLMQQIFNTDVVLYSAYSTSFIHAIALCRYLDIKSLTVFALAVMEYAVGVSKFGKNPMTLLVHQY